MAGGEVDMRAYKKPMQLDPIKGDEYLVLLNEILRTLEYELGPLSGDGAEFRSGARSYFAEALLPFSEMARAIRTESVFKEKSRGGAIQVIGRKE